jgi:hypothetical protein
MTEAARTSETSVDIQLRTRKYIPEDSELRIYLLVISSPFIFIIIFPPISLIFVTSGPNIASTSETAISRTLIQKI